MLNIFMVVYINTAIPNPNRFGLSTPLGTLFAVFSATLLTAAWLSTAGVSFKVLQPLRARTSCKFNIPTSGACRHQVGVRMVRS